MSIVYFMNTATIILSNTPVAQIETPIAATFTTFAVFPSSPWATQSAPSPPLPVDPSPCACGVERRAKFSALGPRVGEKMGEIRSKKCEGRELTKDQLGPQAGRRAEETGWRTVADQGRLESCVPMSLYWNSTSSASTLSKNSPRSMPAGTENCPILTSSL